MEVTAVYETARDWHIYSPDYKGIGVTTALEVAAGSARLAGAPQFPTPIVKEDKLLGETQKYLEGKGEIRWPLEIAKDAPLGELAVVLKLKYMTCNTGGQCDLPKTDEHKLTFKVVEATAAPAPASVTPPPPALGPAAEAVKKHVKWLIAAPRELRAGERGELSVKYELAETWHLYAPDHVSALELGVATRVTIDSPDVEVKEPPSFPKPKEVNNENTVGETHRFLEGKGEIRQPFTVRADPKRGELELKVKVDFMTCDPKTCDPPDTAEATLKVAIAAGGAPAVPVAPVAPAEPPREPQPAPEKPAEEKLPAGAEPAQAQSPMEGSLLALILAMIGGGLLTLIMPCTYPMVPITISFFTKQAESRHGNVARLAAAYGAGIVLVFVFIGVAFAGAIIDFSTDGWVNLVFAALFVVFGLSLLGLYEIRLPSFVNQAASRASGAGGYLGVFLLGTTLVVTSFTCTAPVLGSLLVFASTGGSIWRVVLGMAVFGLTVAAPFVVLSLLPARARGLPRAGEWMHTVKVYLGFVEIAAALKFFSNTDVAWTLEALPRELFLLLCAFSLLVAGLYLFGVIRLKHESSEGVGSGRAVLGLANILMAAYLCVGALGFRLDRFTDAFAPPYQAKKFEVTWQIVEDDFEKGLARAKATGKLAFVNFTGVT